MGSLTRLRAHAGLWTLVALLAVVAVLVGAAAGPVATRIEDRALRLMITDASYLDRDVVVVQPTRPSPPAPADQMLDRLPSMLPSPLRESVETAWGFQRTTVSTFEGVGATLTGDGVVAAPDGFAPVVSLLHQTGLAAEVTIVAGVPPVTSPEDRLIEAMVAAEVAEALGLRAGGEYVLHPAKLVNEPDAESAPDTLTVRISGVFEPADRTAPVWDHIPLLLEPGVTAIPGDMPPPSTLQAALATDQAALDLLFEVGLTSALRPETGARARFDPELVDRAWVPRAMDAVARMRTAPSMERIEVVTRLPELLGEFRRLAASARAVGAVSAAGILATLVGLLVLAARLITDRRSGELTLLRARGGSVPAVVRGLAAEALWVLVPAVTGGWMLHRLLLDEPLSTLPSPTAAVPAAAAAVVGLLVVPVAGLFAVRPGGVVSPRRRDGVRRRAAPARVTVELSVVILAGLGVLLMHRRGLSLAGVDPYLSAVPVLLAVAAGLVALRLYPWPLLLLAGMARRVRGAVGFLALARAGRAAPGAAMALVVLVLAIAVGGFAGTVNTGVAQGRDAGAVQIVGAHVRVVAENMPAEAVSAVSRVPGVTAVAATGRTATLIDQERRSPLRNVAVVLVDTVAYQRVLAEVGVRRQLPEPVLAATPGAEPLPVLAPADAAHRDQLAVRVGEQEHPVRVVGDVAGLPGPDRDRAWMLVPRQAFDAPAQLDELQIAGTRVDPDRVREALAGLVPEPQVSSLAGQREQLEATGFNDGLTLVFLAGTAGGAAGGVLAVALALVVQARARGRTLSLLRTMGLTVGQARRLLLVELLPLTALAVLTGAAVGVALPLLLAPALGLDQFTGGAPLAVTVDPATIALLGGLVLLLVVSGAVVESAVNRRMGLGGALRVE
jgi:putative ABC transport system permease protein